MINIDSEFSEHSILKLGFDRPGHIIAFLLETNCFFSRMPAYDASNWYSLFFIIFLVINLYIFMNVLLAVIFNSYKKHLKVTGTLCCLQSQCFTFQNEVKETVYAKRRKLADAFELIKV